MNRSIVAAGICLMLASPATAQDSGLELVERDAWALERIAQVSRSGRDMPRDVMFRMIDESLDILRGASPDGAYRWARYVPQESGRSTDRLALRPTGPENPDSAESAADLAYAIRVEVPGRRLFVARNRRAYIDRIEIDFRELGAFRRQETIHVGSWIEPGNGREFALPQIARRATARVIGWGDTEERGSAAIQLVWLHPTLSDDAASPHAGSVALLTQIRSAVESRDAEQTAALASQLARGLSPARPPMETARGPIRTEERPTSLPVNRDELLYELRTIDELMRSPGGSPRGTAEQRLRDLIRRIELLPIR